MIEVQSLPDFPIFADSGKKQQPETLKYANGFLPKETLPAEWFNWLLNRASKGITELNTGVASIEQELANLLKEAGLTPESDQYTQVAQAVKVLDDAVLKAAQEHTDKGVAQEQKERIQGDDNTVNSAKAYTNNLFISLFENSGYIQWPGLKSPLEIPALHFEGYSWYEVNYRGNFFRAKGDNAKPFSSKKLTKEQIKNGDYIFKDDEQGDTIRNIKGSVGSMSNVLMSSNSNEKSPPWSAPEGWAVGVGGGYTTYNSYARDLRFDAATVVPTAEENRGRNLTFTFWVLVKDE